MAGHSVCEGSGPQLPGEGQPRHGQLQEPAAGHGPSCQPHLAPAPPPEAETLQSRPGLRYSLLAGHLSCQPCYVMSALLCHGSRVMSWQPCYVMAAVLCPAKHWGLMQGGGVQVSLLSSQLPCRIAHYLVDTCCSHLPMSLVMLYCRLDWWSRSFL